MDHFLSCDWGTSSFRLRLVQAAPIQVLAELKSDQGIADTYKLWLQQSVTVDRQAFYVQILQTQIDALSRDPDFIKAGVSLTGLPVILSGMASSTIGLVDMPYRELPFQLDGSDLNLQLLQQHSAGHPVLVVSGARTDQDVMRGEETKVIGCAPFLKDTKQALQLILPGTHPKHLLVKDNQVQGFKTYMTGEFFDLLAGHSVLAASVEEGGDFHNPLYQESFIDGVKAADGSDLLHTAFMVRTRQVLHQIPARQNYHYLSGLLVGTELKGVQPGLPVYLVGGALHTSLYSVACATLQIPIVKHIDADQALIQGHQLIASTFFGSIRKA